MNNQDWYGDKVYAKFMSRERDVRNGDHMEFTVYSLCEDGNIAYGSTNEEHKYPTISKSITPVKLQEAWHKFLCTIYPDNKFLNHENPENSNCQI